MSDTYDLLIVNVDTDSFSACKPDMSPWTPEERSQFKDFINSKFPDLIRWEDDGYYRRVIVFGSKNYALLPDGKDKIKLKGSSIKDQKKEPAMKELMVKIIDALVYEKNETISDIYKSYVREAMTVKDIARWCSKKNISRSVLDCEGWESKVIQVQNKKGKTVDKTVYFSDHAEDLRMNEINVWEAVKHIEGLQENDRYYMYPTILGEKTITGRVSEKTGKPLKDQVEEITGLKLREQWRQDEDKLKLVKRCFDTIKIFESVLDMEQYKDYSKAGNKKQLEELLK